LMRFVFRFRVMLTILSVAFLMVTALSVLNYYHSKRLLTENYIANLDDKLSLQAQQFDQTMQQMYQQAVHISQLPQVQQLSSLGQDASDAVQDTICAQLQDLLTSVDAQCELYLCLPQAGRAFCSVDYHSDLQAEPQDFAQLTPGIAAPSLTPLFLSNPFVQATQYGFGYAVSIPQAEDGAFLFITLDERLLYYDLLAPLNTTSQERYRLISPDGEICSAQSASERMSRCTFFPSMQGKQMNADIMDDNLLTVTLAAPFSRYFLVCQSDLSAIAGEMKQQLLSQILVLFAAFVILFVISIGVSYWLAKPLRDLAEAMDSVRQGDFSARVEMPKMDEFGALHSRFNALTARLDQLTDQVVQERMQKKQAELSALQYQIRPHFMYNTLNSIRFTAMLQRNQKIADLLGDFIALLESSVQRNGAFIPLREEIHLVRSFVSLQSFRYVDRFSVEYDIAPEAEACYVPCLLLQPVMENAIFHGVDATKDQNLIQVRASVAEDRLHISIEDNGSGFDPEENQTGQRFDNRRLTGIGLKNIAQRLQLYYGDRSSFTIDSTLGTGTCVRFALPVSYDPQEYDL
ncbi:MAG: sensor histidine kinase, partial [Butyricicoccus sp.]|nr:sensor histidine kinase [Butyricicoccus sp.]